MFRTFCRKFCCHNLRTFAESLEKFKLRSRKSFNFVQLWVLIWLRIHRLSAKLKGRFEAPIWKSRNNWSPHFSLTNANWQNCLIEDKTKKGWILVIGWTILNSPSSQPFWLLIWCCCFFQHWGLTVPRFTGQSADNWGTQFQWYLTRILQGSALILIFNWKYTLCEFAFENKFLFKRISQTNWSR